MVDSVIARSHHDKLNELSQARDDLGYLGSHQTVTPQSEGEVQLHMHREDGGRDSQHSQGYKVQPPIKVRTLWVS